MHAWSHNYYFVQIQCTFVPLLSYMYMHTYISKRNVGYLFSLRFASPLVPADWENKCGLSYHTSSNSGPDTGTVHVYIYIQCHVHV